MAKTIITRDPYRNIDTTLSTFAAAEGVPKYTVSHYYWYHRTLEGFRDRPKEGEGNGRKPRTYTMKGKYISCSEAIRKFKVNPRTLYKYRKRLHLNDVESIVKAVKANEQRRLDMRSTCQLSDGSKVTIREFAKAHGATYQAVCSFKSKHNGSVEGFANRKPSREHPLIFHHDKLDMSKSLREWAEYFGTSYNTVKYWVRVHGKTINGFEDRFRRGDKYEFEGRCLTIREWSDVFDIPVIVMRNFVYRNTPHGLKGIYAFIERRKSRI